jgi:DNA repair exonuclease SbcCD ATPase subunit
MVRAAALRPMNVLVLVIGIVFFVVTFAWWALPLTLATYAALIALGTGDPLLQRRVLGRDEPEIPQTRDLSPERRARWLPRGETREKADAALAEYRKVMAAIEASDDVTRAVLDDTVPRLHAAADRLVDVALQREKAAETVRDLRRKPGAAPESENLRRLEEHVDEADEEITATSRELVDVRAKVVRVSIDTSNAQRADDLNASLDELNARLEALGDVAPNG